MTDVSSLPVEGTVATAPETPPNVPETIAPVAETPSTTIPIETLGTALPEAPAVEPPRPLTPGAFLRGEFEVREVLVRGFTNLYLALGGDYVRPVPKLIAECDKPKPALQVVPPLPETEGSAGVQSTSDQAPAVVGEQPRENLAGVLLTDQGEWEAGAEAGAMGHEAAIFDAPAQFVTTETTSSDNVGESAAATAEMPAAEVPATEVPVAETAQASSALPALMMAGEDWEQEDRLYRAWEFENTYSLQDHREPPNDERYLSMLSLVAEALQWASSRGESLDLSHDLLRVDEAGGLRYFGFSLPAQSGAPSPLQQLQEINQFLLVHVFANSGTMRLDDRFAGLPLSEEVKALARHIDEGEVGSLDEAIRLLKTLMPGRPLQVRYALQTDKGRERELNEDSGMILTLQRGNHLHPCDWHLYVVADGMGGHEGGEVASDITIRALSHILSQEVETDWNDNGAIKVLLQRTIDAVNQQVVALTEQPKYRASRARPGSTLTFALRLGSRVFVGNVGDSRAYLWDAVDGLQRISKDHSYVQTLIDAGSLTEEEAWDHPEGSIITAHIGDPKGKTRDVFLRLLRPGDKLLLVSDGVVDMLRDREIAPFLQGNDPASICRQLVDASNERGGADNITVVCVICE
jgi:protein phosphatase